MEPSQGPVQLPGAAASKGCPQKQLWLSQPWTHSISICSAHLHPEELFGNVQGFPEAVSACLAGTLCLLHPKGSLHLISSPPAPVPCSWPISPLSCPMAPSLQPSTPNIPPLLAQNLAGCHHKCLWCLLSPQVTFAGEGGAGFSQPHQYSEPKQCLYSGMELLQQIQLWQHCLVHPKGSSSLDSPLTPAKASLFHPYQLQILIFLPAQGYFPCYSDFFDFFFSRGSSLFQAAVAAT